MSVYTLTLHKNLNYQSTCVTVRQGIKAGREAIQDPNCSGYTIRDGDLILVRETKGSTEPEKTQAVLELEARVALMDRRLHEAFRVCARRIEDLEANMTEDDGR